MRRDATGKPPRRTAVALTRLGMLTAAAFVLSWLELLISLPVRMPGVKLGLCHIAVLFALYRMGWREAAFVSLIRALLAALLFGSLPTLAFSLCGGALSLATMLLLRLTGRFSVLGVSIAGAVCHNLGQLACAALLTGTAGLGWYLPVLLAAGCITGAAVGGAAALTVAALKPKNR